MIFLLTEANYPLPQCLRTPLTAADDLGIVSQPAPKAGSVLFFMDGPLCHGTKPWRSAVPRRGILCKYESRSFTRASSSMEEPQRRWSAQVLEGMSEAQLALMRGPSHDHNIVITSNSSRLCQFSLGTGCHSVPTKRIFCAGRHNPNSPRLVVGADGCVVRVDGPSDGGEEPVLLPRRGAKM